MRSVSSDQVLYGLPRSYVATDERRHLDEARTAADYLVEARGTTGPGVSTVGWS